MSERSHGKEYSELTEINLGRNDPAVPAIGQLDDTVDRPVVILSEDALRMAKKRTV